MSVSYHTIIILSLIFLINCLLYNNTDDDEIWDMGYVAIWDTYNTYGTTIAHAPHRISIRGGETNN